MNQNSHLEQHPDADRLNAFVEHALTEFERQETLSHLAGCARCREIVYLGGGEVEAPGTMVAPVSLGTALASPETRSSFGDWFGGRHWLRLVGPAVGLVVIAGVVWHKSSESRSNANVANQAPASATMQSAKLEAPSLPDSQRAPAAKPSALPKSVSLADKKIALVAEKNVSPQQSVTLATSPARSVAVTAPTVSAGLTHTGISADSVIASEAQPKVTAGETMRVRVSPPAPTLQSAQVLRPDLSSRRESSASATMSQMAYAPPLPPVSPPAVQVATAAATARMVAASKAAQVSQADNSGMAARAQTAAVKAKKLVPMPLPGGAMVISMTNIAQTGLAVDASGNLFLTSDGGAHWRMVPVQWTGQAASVRQQASPLNLQVLEAKAGGTRSPVFELTTSEGKIWTSVDGAHWTVIRNR